MRAGRQIPLEHSKRSNSDKQSRTPDGNLVQNVLSLAAWVRGHIPGLEALLCLQEIRRANPAIVAAFCTELARRP